MKTMKKVSSLILALLLIAGMCSVPAMAAEAGCLNTLSDTVYTFEDSVDVTKYVNQEFTESTNATTYAGNTVAFENLDGNMALKLTNGNTSNGLRAITYYKNDASARKMNMKFSFMRTGADAGNFNLSARTKGTLGYEYSIFRMQDGVVYLFANNVYKYELGKWYDIEVSFDLDAKFGRLTIGEKDSANKITVDMPYTKLLKGGLFGYTASNLATGIMFNWYSGTSTPETVYIDNFMQNSSDIKPTLDSHDDNFDDGILPTINTNSGGRYNQTSIETRTGWTYTNTNTAASTTAAISNGELTFNTTSGYAEIGKYPFVDAADVRHRVSLKMNGPDYNDNNEASRSIMVRFAKADGTQNAGTTSDAYLMKNFIDFTKGYLQGYNMGGTDERIGLNSDPDFMYPIEFVYDAGDKLCVFTVTDQNGTQHEVDLSAKIQTFMDTLRGDGTTGGVWYNLNGVGVRYSSGNNGTVCRIDDFNWDIFNDTAITATPSVKYTGNDGSPLDETVKFAFNRPISSDATVAVTSNGEAVTTPYTTNVESGVLSVKFSDLALNTSYDVTVDVDALESDVTPAESYTHSFNTANAAAAISATTPVKADNTISSTITSYYAEGRPAMLIAALYKDKKLVRIVKQPLDKADSRDGEEIALTVSGSDYDEIRSFVWSGFAQLLPYSGVFKQ